ncbi:hypothetical protein BS17DRAFT_783885 [Gyrodon lividus]|nr:hypothetical protein BS17DRAFT_783885 [Gyrodon lividus]
MKGYHYWLPQCFSKLYIFRLTAFTKVLFLDADMLCLGDFSEVFTIDTPFGTLTDNHLLFNHREGVPQTALLRSLKTRYGISAACFCITPSLLEFDRATERLHQRSADTVDGTYFETVRSIQSSLPGIPVPRDGILNAGPDEQLLGWMYFHSHITDFTAWTTISCLYNCQSFRVVRDVPPHLRADVRIIHYVTQKPWDKCGGNGKIWPDMEVWFDQLESLMAVVESGGATDMNMAIKLNSDDKRVFHSLREGNEFLTPEEAQKVWSNGYV